MHRGKISTVHDLLQFCLVLYTRQSRKRYHQRGTLQCQLSSLTIPCKSGTLSATAPTGLEKIGITDLSKPDSSCNEKR